MIDAVGPGLVQRLRSLVTGFKRRDALDDHLGILLQGLKCLEVHNVVLLWIYELRGLVVLLYLGKAETKQVWLNLPSLVKTRIDVGLRLDQTLALLLGEPSLSLVELRRGLLPTWVLLVHR